MPTLTIITEYDQHDHPLRAAVHNHDTDNLETIPLYIKGSGRTLAQIDDSIACIRQYYSDAIDGPNTIITNRFKIALAAYELPLPESYLEYEVYDIDPRGKYPIASTGLLKSATLMDWQKLVANSAVVYHDMELAGIIHNEQHRTPSWRQDVITGRSSCSGFNIQGISKIDDIVSVIRTARTSENDALLHFDWIAADIMVVAYMSQDQVLLDAFKSSDPYTYLAECLHKPRDECKQLLLSDLNNLNLSSEVFNIYTQLKRWMMERIQRVQATAQLETFLGRSFRIKANTREEIRKIFNYTIQGGTAHLMQAALCKMRPIPAVYIVADLHDGLVLICHDAPEILMSCYKTAKVAIAKPLDTVSICMPFRISKCKVSDGWHRWIPIMECRNGTITRSEANRV